MPEIHTGLCEECETQLASIHLCDGSTGNSRNLCEECLGKENSLTSIWLEEAKVAKCEYCGGSPCGGGTDTLAQITGAPLRIQWICLPCSMEYHSHLATEMDNLPKGLPNDQQMQALIRVVEESKSHMSRYVAMRDN